MYLCIYVNIRIHVLTITYIVFYALLIRYVLTILRELLYPLTS